MGGGLEFQENFPKEGCGGLRGKAQFERLVRSRLTQFLSSCKDPIHLRLRERSFPGESATTKCGWQIPEGLSDPSARFVSHWFMYQVRSVPLTGVDPKSIREETRRDLDLAAVYTALMTHRSEGDCGTQPRAGPRA